MKENGFIMKTQMIQRMSRFPMKCNAGIFMVLLFLLSLQPVKTATAQGLYFPSVNPLATWDTVSPESLNWCTGKIAPLYGYLEQENTKGFIVLKDGRIVLEKYFGTFTADSLWYWASAGKTITACLVGRAQEDGFLSITEKSSKYLGQGWSSCTPAQEDKITIRNQLTMTSGLDDGVPDNHCTLDTCLEYLADAGTRWAYHNAPYTLLEKVLVNATGQPVNTLTQLKLKTQTGMNGFWYTVDYDNVFFSNARSMARFGLLMQNKCVWDGGIMIHDTAFVRQLTNTSQPVNNSYGYLWWLNGKSSFMLPSTQFVFPGPLAPHAPADMFAGLGKNGQIVSISPSMGIVMVRMGNQPVSPGSEIANQLCDNIWQRLNEVICTAGSVQDHELAATHLLISPNPASGSFTVELPNQDFDLSVFDITGRITLQQIPTHGKTYIDCSALKAGIYIVKATNQKTVVYSGRLTITPCH
jgi:CubicO group peptidase (beta-lactamase class C family)